MRAFPLTGRRDYEDADATSEGQRDQTTQLTEFERILFTPPARIFFITLYQIVTLDDDLVGTRAADFQVKKLSPRKLMADVFEESLLNCVFSVRFRRRGGRVKSRALFWYWKGYWRLKERKGYPGAYSRPPGDIGGTRLLHFNGRRASAAYSACLTTSRGCTHFSQHLYCEPGGRMKYMRTRAPKMVCYRWNPWMVVMMVI